MHTDISLIDIGSYSLSLTLKYWITITINTFHSSAWVKVHADCVKNFAMYMFSCQKDTYNMIINKTTLAMHESLKKLGIFNC